MSQQGKTAGLAGLAMKTAGLAMTTAGLAGLAKKTAGLAMKTDHPSI